MNKKERKYVLPDIKIDIGEIYDFAKDRLDTYAHEIVKSDKQKWVKTGRVDILSQLLHWVKHYEEN